MLIVRNSYAGVIFYNVFYNIKCVKVIQDLNWIIFGIRQMLEYKSLGYPLDETESKIKPFTSTYQFFIMYTWL